MAKKKNKQASQTPLIHIYQSNTKISCSKVLRPWCWYCEREFEDEKGLLTRVFVLRIQTLCFSFDAASEGQTLQMWHVSTPS
jgi:hypothetical protein